MSIPMTPVFRFEGIYTPLVTPWQPDGRADFDALAEVIEFLVAAGVHGLISGGSTGENYAQTVDERIEIARFTHERLAGRLPFVVGTGAMLTGESIARAVCPSSAARRPGTRSSGRSRLRCR